MTGRVAASSTVIPDQSITYEAFGAWYDRYREAVLEPVLERASAALDAELLDVLSDRDLARLRNASGRVKSKRRTWRKIRQQRYKDQIRSLDDIPEVIDDLVGLRITCTNLRDIEMVQVALERLPRSGRSRRGRPSPLWLDEESERDYVVDPKASGYRGWHVNLGINIELDGEVRPAVCELQVRTLLQDSWGELTHEDTYSKDGALPPLVEVLSKRMADLFATLDDIAEDLRTELDRIDQLSVGETGERPATEPDVGQESTGGRSSELLADASAFLTQQWEGLDRPTDLAVLAWSLQREFGAEISDDWFGHGTFKRFVLAALPQAQVSTGRHVFLLPAGSEIDDEAVPADAEAATTDSSAANGIEEPDDDLSPPPAAEALRRVDRAFPLLDTEGWSALFEALAEAADATADVDGTPSAIHRLARSARDRATNNGHRVSRRHVAYVADALFAAEDAPDGESAEELAERFTVLTLQRMTELRVLGARNRRGRAAVRTWLGTS